MSGTFVHLTLFENFIVFRWTCHQTLILQMVKFFKLNMQKNVLINLSKLFLDLFHHSIRTIVGVVCKDGVILGAEKVLTSMLMLPKTDRRIYNVSSHIGMVFINNL